ncbi:hypothetical protein FQN55_004743 [Onygenales sp. PD_40]|nr:hypothetical protein FQN55_004743 [Onygenales sp. PD_40]
MGFSVAFYTFLLTFAVTVWSKTVSYQLELTWEQHSPDGFLRDMILINGQFPGPRLEMDQGDEVDVVVVNSMPFDTSIHFHGIEQLRTMWSDGSPGVTQRPIHAGKSFLYKWVATEYGSYWYHSHSRGQIDDGLIGPILIRPDPSLPLPLAAISSDSAEVTAMAAALQESKSMLVGDWTHEVSSDVWEVAKASRVDLICPDSILINGKGSVTCPTPEELADPGPLAPILGNQSLTAKGCLPPDNALGQGDFPHDYTKLPDEYFYICNSTQGASEIIEVAADQTWISFDWISHAGMDALAISIDEHPMLVYAVDGRFIEPYEVDSLVIDPGARYSVMVKVDKHNGRKYAIRVNNKGANQVLGGTAILSYAGEPDDTPSEAFIDRFGYLLSPDFVEFQDAEAIPFPPIAPGTDVNQTFIFDIGRWGASYLWTVNGIARYPDLDWAEDLEPILFDPSTANPNVTIETYNDTWVDLVFRANPINPPHPVHKHSNKVFVIGRGDGPFEYSTVAEAMAEIPENFDLQSPLLRDTWIPPPAATGPTWTAVRYHVVNPGPSFLHCHIQLHLAGGMALVMLDGVDAWPVVPPEYLNGNGM